MDIKLKTKWIDKQFCLLVGTNGFAYQGLFKERYGAMVHYSSDRFSNIYCSIKEAKEHTIEMIEKGHYK